MNPSDWFKLARAEHGVLVLVGIVASGWLASAGHASLPFLVWAGVGPVLVTWAAFILNDYVDLPSDTALARTDRPLVSGKIQPATAHAVGFGLLALGVAQSAFITSQAFAVCASFGVLAVAYSTVLKKLPAVGHVFIGLSMAVPLLYGNWAVTPYLLLETGLFAASAFLIGLGRELLITLRDVKGDAVLGAKTLPMILGATKTAWLASFLLWWGTGVAAGASLARESTPYWAFLALASVFVSLTISRVLFNPSVLNLKQARTWTLAALACGLLAYVGLAF